MYIYIYIYLGQFAINGHLFVSSSVRAAAPEFETGQFSHSAPVVPQKCALQVTCSAPVLHQHMFASSDVYCAESRGFWIPLAVL